MGQANGDSEPHLSPEKKIYQFLRQHWGLEEGLPQIAVLDMVQDRDGFLWLGTQDGLARFDGLDFEVFKTDTTPGLVHDDIRRLAIDRDGALWVGTREGVSRFDRSVFSVVEPQEGRFEIVHGLTPTSDGVLIASDTGLYRHVNGQVVRVLGVPEEPAYFADVGGDGLLLAGLTGRVREIGPDGTREFPLPSYASKAVPKLLLRGCGGTWVATSVGLFRLESRALVVYESLPSRNVHDLHCDAGGTLWVGTGRGIYRLRSGRLIEAVEDTEQFEHLWISSFLAGRSGGLWLGSLAGGLYRLTDGRYTRHTQLDGLPSLPVTTVTRSRDGGIWLAGDAGVARLRNDLFSTPVANNTLLGDVTMTLLEDRSRRVWIGQRNGLSLFDPATGAVSRLLNDGVAALAEDGDGAIWIGGIAGLYVYREGQVRRLGPDEGIDVRLVRTLLWSPHHGMLVGTENGVFVQEGMLVDGSLGFVRFDTELFEDGRMVVSLLEDAAGDVWVGYHGDGLGRYSAKNDRWRLYREGDGLLSDAIYHLTWGHDGWLWLSSIKGLYRVDPSSFAGGRITTDVVISVTGHEPGSSQGYCCSGGGSAAGALTSDGLLWLPTLDGIVAVDTTEAAHDHAPPKTIIREMRFGGRPYAFSANPEMVVPPQHRDIEFAFTAPSFDKPEFVRFDYILEGYDDDWRVATEQRSVRYTNLPAGKYLFRVVAVSGNGVRSRAEATWSFSIRRHFTETPWFIGLIVLGVALAGYAVQRVRFFHLQRQRDHLEELVEERTSELKAVNEELGQINTRLQQQSYTDPLTTLRNRRYFAERIGQDLAQVRRLRANPADADKSIIFLIADLDRFKQINDTYGHQAGDEVLAEVARRLLEMARDSDYVIRWGGEEFLLVACFSPERSAPRIAERIIETVWREPFETSDGNRLTVSCSVGFAAFPFGSTRSTPARGPDRDERSWEQIVSMADHALYIVKKNGRDGWAGIMPSELMEEGEELVDVAHQIGERLASGELELVSSRPMEQA